MTTRAKRFASLLALLIAAILVVDLVWVGVALSRGRELTTESQPFERDLPQADRRLLVIGDSTAVGTGASHPHDSVAGRLAQALPDIAVINLARDGARIQDVLAQLRNAPGEDFDVVLIQAGGNDILRFTPPTQLRETTSALLKTARSRADTVVMMTTGDVGTAPAFPIPLDWLFSWQTRRARAVFLDLAAEHAIEYVDLFVPSRNDPFRSEPERFHARDGLHPSSEGYRMWFEKLIEVTSILERLGGPDRVQTRSTRQFREFALVRWATGTVASKMPSRRLKGPDG